jgi:hypothetical protein
MADTKKTYHLEAREMQITKETRYEVVFAMDHEGDEWLERENGCFVPVSDHVEITGIIVEERGDVCVQRYNVTATIDLDQILNSCADVVEWSEIDAEREFDYPAIEEALIEQGAAAAEADALTEILHVEGWGGIEDTNTRNFTRGELWNMIVWLRENRPVEAR